MKKFYEIVGRVVVYVSLYAIGTAGFVWAFLQNTVY